MKKKEENTLDKEEIEKVLKKVGSRIKKLRIKKGYTNYEYFAWDHHIPRSQYARYEQGKDLRLSSLLKVLKALDITLEEFFQKGFD